MSTNLEPLIFEVIPPGRNIPSNVQHRAFLNRDLWDDWGKFCTQFFLTIVDSDGRAHRIGNVKIGEFNLRPLPGGAGVTSGFRYPDIPKEFSSLNDSFFSLGQEDEYYENLNKLNDLLRKAALVSLRDVAYDSELWFKAKNEYVTTESLCRSVTKTTVEGQYFRMAHGGARRTKYRFSFTYPTKVDDGKPPIKLDFNVNPETVPPTNVHVIIGRNGVGKTFLLTLMAKAFAPAESAPQQLSIIVMDNQNNNNKFANLVTVSFSAFDDSQVVLFENSKEDSLQYSYIGLRENNATENLFGSTKNPDKLANEFVSSLKACRSGARQRRWNEALNVLDSDPIFRLAGLTDLIKLIAQSEQESEVLQKFKRLSSGHKIVLLTLTRLVETVEEKTLVLIDEPEAHLHPPLLSAFIRALSKLLADRNGVAVIATHSPVVLQEVPKSCVWILRGYIKETNAERPPIETFGENVGILSREVFQLELRQAGFHKILQEAVEKYASYEEAINEFDDQLGSEAKAVLQVMFLEKMKR